MVDTTDIKRRLKTKPSGSDAADLIYKRVGMQLADPTEYRMSRSNVDGLDAVIDEFSADRSVLDVGCMGGFLYGYLAERGLVAPDRYLGLDNWPEAIGAAQRRFPGVAFECRDFVTDGIPGQWDVVWSSQLNPELERAYPGRMGDVAQLLTGHARSVCIYGSPHKSDGAYFEGGLTAQYGRLFWTVVRL